MGRFDGKTEKATPRRRRKARQEGQVARSQEVGVALSLAGGLVTLQAFAPRAGDALRHHTALLYSAATSDQLPAVALRHSVPAMFVAALAPMLATAVVLGVAGGIAQVGFTLAPKAARPKLSNLKLKRGLERFRPAKMSWELTRSVLKVGLLSLLLWYPLRDAVAAMGARRDLGGGLDQTLGQARDLLGRAAVLALAIAVADYAWNRWRTAKEQKMTKHEVRQEHKDTDGDPLIKAQRRRRAVEYSRNRMLRDVAGADVVVTNPTRFAVALHYAPTDAAPRVVAKGLDKMAARIRSEAYRNGVFVTEDRVLARALYRRVQVGQFVPAALFEAVAVVLALAYRRRSRRPAPAHGAAREVSV